MIIFRYIILLTILLQLATACVVRKASTPDKQYVPQPQEITKSTESVDLSDKLTVSTKLLGQYIEWQDTPYKVGGLDKYGVDCSGFVYLTFRSKLGYDIPRTTGSQVEVGSTVSRKSLRSGDLIFFKTGLFSRHVGIYISGKSFLHASTSQGVIISSLKNSYWQKNFWKAKRLIAE